MNNADQINEAHEGHLRNTSLMLAAQDLESATYAARKAREDLRRATACRMSWEERHGGAKRLHGLVEAADFAASWNRVEFAAWALQDAKRNVEEKLQDYRSALKRIEVLGATVGEADSHEVPAYLRHRARKAIALADAFGNKVAMDATLHEDLERPVLPELSPEVEVQEFRVIDPLEPVEAWTPPEPRAKLVPVEDYSPEGPVQRYADTGNPYSALGNDAEDPEDGEPVETWRTGDEEEEEKNLAPVCPECRDGKCGNCDGTAWDDTEDEQDYCSCDLEDHGREVGSK